MNQAITSLYGNNYTAEKNIYPAFNAINLASVDTLLQTVIDPTNYKLIVH